MSTRADAAPAIAPMPGLVYLLLAGAALHLVITLVTRTVVGGYLELAPGAVVSYALTAMPLVLAAGLIAGRDRWSAGRHLLIAAALAFGLVAVVDAAGWIWTSLAWPPESSEAYEWPTLLRSALLLAGAIAAPLLAAAGITARPGPASAAGRWARARWLSMGLVAIVVVLCILPIIGYYDDVLPFFDGENERPLVAALAALSLLAPVPMSILGLAATRALPGRYLLPEALIAIGAMAAALGTAASSSAYLFLREPAQQELVVPVVVASLGLALLGYATVALGFFTARISAPGQP